MGRVYDRYRPWQLRYSLTGILSDVRVGYSVV
jgi:hypothetical protein